mmetsp:Transcript_27306/g.76235  ORF Transcript_27306/g.76235 Transcript_27306/m.76235 type:complete len:245 (+) Transcript_27306:191-925(+)
MAIRRHVRSVSASRYSGRSRMLKHVCAEGRRVEWPPFLVMVNRGWSALRPLMGMRSEPVTKKSRRFFSSPLRVRATRQKCCTVGWSCVNPFSYSVLASSALKSSVCEPQMSCSSSSGRNSCSAGPSHRRWNPCANAENCRWMLSSRSHRVYSSTYSWRLALVTGVCCPPGTRSTCWMPPPNPVSYSTRNVRSNVASTSPLNSRILHRDWWIIGWTDLRSSKVAGYPMSFLYTRGGNASCRMWWL